MPEPQSPSDKRSNLIKYAAFCLNRRPYFREVLRQKLVQRAKKLKLSNTSSVILEILNDLQKNGYLDDQYLAEAFARRQLSKCYGPKIISLKLHHLKLGNDVINQALDEADIEKQIEAIKRYISKNNRQDKYKLISKLYSRGFNSSVINKVFDVEYLED